MFLFVHQSQEIDVLIGKDRETFYTSGLTLGSKKCSVLRDSLQDDGDWTMDIRTKSQGGEPTYNISVGRAGKGKRVVPKQYTTLKLIKYCLQVGYDLCELRRCRLKIVVLFLPN